MNTNPKNRIFKKNPKIEFQLKYCHYYNFGIFKNFYKFKYFPKNNFFFYFTGIVFLFCHIFTHLK